MAVAFGLIVAAFRWSAHRLTVFDFTKKSRFAVYHSPQRAARLKRKRFAEIMINLFEEKYRNRSVFLTGHTGFKGTWMLRWLNLLGADVTAFALPAERREPLTPSTVPSPNKEYLDDIRNADTLAEAVRKSRPEIVFHFAAQALVRRSYADPLGTFATNVQGTANLLDACRRCDSVRGIVVITSDKCYRNNEWDWGYREIDPLGGRDPYSASKSCAEIVAESFRLSFPGLSNLATCRSGNIIGGGDWSEDRLVPDLMRAAIAGETTFLRMPEATRPWQHVLDPLHAYLLLGAKFLDGQENFSEQYGQAWNFGPNIEGNLSVGDVAGRMSKCWEKIRFSSAESSGPHEARLLMLDCSKARHRLGWKPVWNIDETIRRTVDWYRQYIEGGIDIAERQIADFVANAQSHFNR